ncbi:hypothetical protein CHRY9390_02436 [Chryseobacterium aquaeductus]|uniref:Transposase n=1 Tax=Chryseobacterium aquaeductus TaxID=2675056 RepID=A0A9N8QSU0_9FLAO|nr:helix-turn-helix domain-containing protein [Chryseobacterium aquaeductus]CAA7331722.1 hypothetical protein CHRY9390_02436 [Chryseobacterium potabilaquae]CAD7811915.1 hypothetical protein CHRY9390_02436 [Chryseobacterium aquaeductus]
MKNTNPNYRQIYLDILAARYPEKLNDNTVIAKINSLSTDLDILFLNDLIFGERNPKDEIKNQKLRSYSKESIFKILHYQKQYNLNNSQLSRKFKLSRTTISRWRKIFSF